MADQEIIELLRNNSNDKAFLALYKHFPLVRKMIISRGGKLEDAEDIYQEALIVLCRKVTQPEFKLTAQLSTYLFSVCRFMWNDELKKRGKQNLVEFDDNIDKAEEDSLNEILEKESQNKIAEKIINELGDRCKELLLLFYSGTMKLKDIASKMGYSSENTAKNQKYKCLENAKNKLQELKALHHA